MTYTVAALYKFAALPRFREMQAEILAACKQNGVCGSLLLAHEGINGTIAGTAEEIEKILAFLNNYPALAGFDYKLSFANDAPFYRMKVRLKKEIVTIGIDGVNPNETVGTYVDPEEWNKIISDPDVIVLDTRNDYEVEIGTFKNAIDPRTKTFREFPAYVKKHFDNQKHKKVAMFCTGGIRCEKASSYMKQIGFDTVYHLKGGILKYLETMPKEKSLWEGDCFVFDQRVSVGHGLALGDYILCPSCRHPVSAEERKNTTYEEGVSCPHCFDTLTAERKAASRERQKQIKLAEARGERHLGADYECEGQIA